MSGSSSNQKPMSPGTAYSRHRYTFAFMSETRDKCEHLEDKTSLQAIGEEIQVEAKFQFNYLWKK